MGRQLRPRKPRPDYVPMAGFDIKEDNIGLGGRTGLDEASSDSEFAPENDKDATEQMQQDIRDDEDMRQDFNIQGKDKPESSEPSTKLPLGVDVSSSKSKGKTIPKNGNAHPNLTTGPSRQRRQMYALPNYSIDHRHRAVPLYRREGRVERLKQPAKLFKPPNTMMTNGLDQDSVMKRLTKAWGHNAGPGPLWEMVEDRSWFKEAKTIGKGGDTEAERRPLVHQNVRVKNGWKALTEECVHSFHCGRQNSCVYLFSFQGCSSLLAHYNRRWKSQTSSSFLLLWTV